ncbi:MAG: 1,6-anhydro-N-acetylmuramyl-L-alanine amidase AmpD [Burkholderiaceae bacterium]
MRAPQWQAGWLTAARKTPSPNADERPAGVATDLVVIHHISLPPGHFAGPAIEALFCNRLDCASDPAFESLDGLTVSSHFLIRRHGQLQQFVDVERRAWHAGQSSFQDRTRCNDFSIGIELEGDLLRPFTNRQYQRLEFLLTVLAERLPLKFIAGHSEIAPGRKFDPGPLFDWSRLHKVSSATGLKRPYGADC